MLKKRHEEYAKDSATKQEYATLRKNLRLQKELNKVKRENEFLKKRQKCLTKVLICG